MKWSTNHIIIIVLKYWNKLLFKQMARLRFFNKNYFADPSKKPECVARLYINSVKLTLRLAKSTNTTCRKVSFILYSKCFKKPVHFQALWSSTKMRCSYCWSSASLAAWKWTEKRALVGNIAKVAEFHQYEHIIFVEHHNAQKSLQITETFRVDPPVDYSALKSETVAEDLVTIEDCFMCNLCRGLQDKMS